MRKWLCAAVLMGLLAGCGDNGVDDYSVNSADTIGAYTVFDSSGGDIPYPNDILYAPNSSGNDLPGDGTLNIPYEDGDTDASVKRALNTLDGFSTISPISVGLTAEVDAATLPGNVRLFEVVSQASAETHFIPAVGAITAELTYGVDFVATVSGSRLAIIPLNPLKSHTGYMVVLTGGIETSDGRALAPDMITAMLNGTHPLADGDGNPTVYFDPDPVTNAVTAQTLEGLRRLTQAMFAQLSGQPGMECSPEDGGLACSNVIMAWSFTTQTIGAVQDVLAESSMQAQLTLGNSELNTSVFGLPYGNADIYVGTLANLPQYMPQGAAALSGTFSYNGNGDPVIEANATIPVLATVPNDTLCAKPAEGWPVVIYQHGITRMRTDLLAYAETFAAPPLCSAAVAIDLPLHGVTDPANPFYVPGLERTFDIDIAREVALDGYGLTIESYSLDGIIDSTGAHYMNLASLLTTRDHMRQTTSDLLQFQHALGTAAGVDFDGNNIHFVSHSLGTIASVGYLTHTTGVRTATLAMPGQGVIQLLNHSTVFGPIVKGGLASFGIIDGTPEYDAFMIAAQTLVDDVDPANYTAEIAANDTLPMLFFEAVGDDTPGSGDLHIPNSIPTAPLSGTDPFLRLVGAVDINTPGLTAGDPYVLPTAKSVTRLTVGEHRSPLDPQYSAEATAEIHTEMATFVGSGGAFIVVSDPTNIQE
jgi:hypothetical protein